MQISKHQQQRGRSQAGPRQRKWSDWSECTINCVKVRHRFICDDILRVEQESNTKNRTSATTTTTTTDRNLTKRQNESPNGDEDDQLMNSPEDDYADDGDEIEPDVDTDLCDKVDTSKTFEEAPCIGGLCKLSNLYNQVTPATTTPAATQPPKQRHHHSNLSKHKASLSDKDSKENVPDKVNINFRPGGGRQQQTLASRYNNNKSYPLALDEPEVSGGGRAYLHKATLRSGEIVQPVELTISNSSFPQQPQQQQAASSVWTKAIWPTRQLLAGNYSESGGPEQFGQPSPQAILIQWSILIGSLLAIILLILLILRKLLATAFPSYHWMLAKQMIKSTSDKLGINSDGAGRKRRLADNCCRGLAPPPHHHRCLNSLPGHHQHQLAGFSCASSGALLLAETNNQSPTSTANIQTHLCYSCHHHRNQMLPASIADNNFITCTTNSLKSPTNNPIQCIVDLNGRHLINGTSINNEQIATRFNTDQLDLITPAMDPPSYVYASMTQTSSTNSSRTKQHYDTVNNEYSNASLGYEDPLNLVPERAKAYIVPSKSTSGESSKPG